MLAGCEGQHGGAGCGGAALAGAEARCVPLLCSCTVNWAVELRAGLSYCAAANSDSLSLTAALWVRPHRLQHEQLPEQSDQVR